MTHEELRELVNEYMQHTWGRDLVKPDNNLSLPREISLVAGMDSPVTDELGTFVDELKAIDPSQTFYSKSDMHMTLLGGLDTSLDVARHESGLERVVSSYILEFSFELLTANHSGLAVVALPIGFSISSLRTDIRDVLGLPQVPYKSSARLKTVFENIGWVSVLRFTSEPKQELIDFIKDNRNRQFCTGKVVSIGAYEISKLIFKSHKDTTKIFEFSLQQS